MSGVGKDSDPSAQSGAAEWKASAARQLVERARLADEKIPQAARARVWNEVERRRAQPNFRLAWPMFVAGALTASLFLVWQRVHETAARTVEVIALDGSRQSVRPGQTLPRSRERELVDLRSAGRMVLGPNGVVRLERFDAEGIELDVERGSLLAHVTPRPARAPLFVRTSQFRAKVVGTVFRVVVQDDGSSSLAVGHGAVEVQPFNGGPLVLVRSGERWPDGSSSGSGQGRDRPMQPELDLLGAAELEGTTVDSFAPPVVMPETPSCEAAADGAEDRVGCYLSRAAELDRNPLEAESSLYQAGWIALTELHRPARALSIWNEERNRFPSGVLGAEVHASVIDALLALHDHKQAQQEVDAFLARDPNGLRSAEMHYVRGTLFRELDGNCGRARPEFDRALSHAQEPWARSARAARAACAPEGRGASRVR